MNYTPLALFSGGITQTLLFAVAIILGVVACIWLGGKIFAWRRGDASSQNDTEQRLREDAEPDIRNESIGLRKWPKRWTPTAKLFFLAATLSVGLFTYAAWTYAKTGSPGDTAFLEELSVIMFGLVLMWGGAFVYRRQESKATELSVIHESKNGTEEETMYCEKALMRPIYDDDKNETVALEAPLFHKKRVLGIFWRRKFNADEAELRGRDYRLATDRAIVRIPISDESTTVEGDRDKITVHTKQRKTVDDPNQNYDYRFVPSDRKSTSEIDQLHKDKEELESDLKHERRLNAVLSNQVREYEEMLENQEYFQSQRQRSWMAMFLPLMTGMSSQQADQLMDMDPEEVAERNGKASGTGMQPWPNQSPDSNGTSATTSD
ncbi:hypothetical protein G9464_20885 [Halostella sp. JP-L12]|uniref:hypothetical protein n=1 Tax=Halostella TaxID=1843185 RepID=UPI000EF7C0B8|nr:MULTISPECIES: hypothetical protein [Halostella]NHN50028.1 hypothetical protein [Halostella sp. JP-L12]